MRGRNSVGREEKLKDLHASGSERSRATQEIQSPHPYKFLAVAKTIFFPRPHESRLPGPQGGDVVGSEIVHVFINEEALCRLQDLRHAGEGGIREDVAGDPAVAQVSLFVAGDRMAEEEPVFLEAPFHRFHIGAVVFGADMLEHPDAHDRIVFSLQFAVILQQDLDRQVGAMRIGISFLFLRDSDAGDIAAMVLSSKACQATPTASDVQHAHAGLEGELFADQFHFQFLRCGQIRGALEIGARVLHRGIQHRAEKIIPEIVVLPSDHAGAGLALEIEQKRERDLHERA